MTQNSSKKMHVLKWTHFITLLILLTHLVNYINCEDTKSGLKYPTFGCSTPKRLEVLPGRGWDNLRNREVGQLTSITYTECRTTPDGRYLIPDGTSAIALKETGLTLYSEIIDNWANYSSVDTQSFSASAEGSMFGFQISGSFSSEFQTVKSRQVGESSVTSRVQAREMIYRIVTEPSAPIDKSLKNLILEASQELEQNHTNIAQFLLELIVRDYGTHYLTRVDAGAILVQEDFLNRKFVQNNVGQLADIKAAAAVGFWDKFGASVGYRHFTNSSMTTSYQNSVTSSIVRTMGGAPLKHVGSSMFKEGNGSELWIDTIMDNLVAIDRFGDPLYFIVSPQNFPDMPIPQLARLASEFKSAIDKYYTYNTRIGCTSMDSSNFDYDANVDDKSCHDPYNNYTFGGVYQTCQVVTEQGRNRNFCEGQDLKNPFTGDYKCQLGYESMQLRSREVDTYIKYCFIWCWHVPVKLVISTFWCYAHRNVSANSGIMFGGTFTSKIGNRLTGAKSCPATFFDLQIAKDLHICLGDDYELGFRYSIPFGGLFSCQFGNPLYDMKLTLRAGDAGGKKRLGGSLDSLPRACPGGFSQHTASVDGECVINYCVKANSLSDRGSAHVIMPPYTSFESLYGYSLEGQGDQTGGQGQGLGGWGIAFITLVCILMVVLIGFLGVWWRKRRGSASALSSSSGNLEQESENEALIPEGDDQEDA